MNRIGALGLIPARGGSKGIPRKNLRAVGGIPLVTHAVMQSLGAASIGRTLISTDDEEIRDVALAAGGEVPFMRPIELAEDTTPTLGVVQHTLNWLRLADHALPVLVVLLQPTSPLRRSWHIDEAVDLLCRSQADSVVSVTEFSPSPLLARTVDKNRHIKELFSGGQKHLRRQDMPTYYYPNGAIYVLRSALVLSGASLLGQDTRAYLMDAADSVDIDCNLDLQFAEMIYANRAAEEEQDG